MNESKMNSEECISNLDEVCRVCLSKMDKMRPLLSLGDEGTLVSKLSALSNSVIVLIDKYPSLICNICEIKLNEAYSFQKLCKRSNAFLNEYLTSKDFLVTVDSNYINLNKTLDLEIISEVEHKVTDNNLLTEDIENTQAESTVLSQIDVPDNYNLELLDIKKTEGAEQSDDDESSMISLNFMPRKIDRTKGYRLEQYAAEDVKQIIHFYKQKFYKYVTCVLCQFETTNIRSLSAHMTRIHKDMKNKWCLSCNKIVENRKEHLFKRHADDLRCPLCKTLTTSMSHFLEHLASHAVEKLYQCPLCQKSFISKRTLILHKMKHLKKSPFNCKICGKKFSQRKSFRNHFKNQMKCMVCERKFCSEAKLNEHKCFLKTTENLDENISLETENCDNKSDIFENDHELELTVAQNFCEICNKKVRSLNKHLKRFHNLLDPNSTEQFKNLCSHCGKRFKCPSKLSEHLRIHTGENPFKCKFCDRQMKTKGILISHERTHTGEKPYLCKVCGKAFAQTSSLNTHLKIHTGRTEECNICNKKFCRKAELKLHMRQHTGEKPYPCLKCEQAFKQSSHLAEHMKTHSDDRPFKCKYCEKGFKQAGTLKSHLQIHLGQKPYKCTMCSYACRQSYSLTTHMLQHGLNKEGEKEYTCNVCSRRYNTVPHFLAHYNRYHGHLEITDVSKALVLLDDEESLEPFDNKVILDNKIVDAEIEEISEETEL